jgi:hypothetical protein
LPLFQKIRRHKVVKVFVVLTYSMAGFVAMADLENAALAGSGAEVLRHARSRATRLGIVVAGIVLGQAILYGPSLIGNKVLLPLDILAESDCYLPQTPQTKAIEPKNSFAGDLILLYEPARRFAISELRAGRLPMWIPNQFAGSPFIAPKFSPFLLLEYCTKSPVVLAWAQLAAALVAGVGAYAFFRRVLGVGFWAAAICAWCYPITAFFVLWEGYPVTFPVCWLPWLLMAVDKTVRRSSPLAPIGLGALTCVVLTSGQLDVAGQVLLISGVYALWCLWAAYGKRWFHTTAVKAASALAAGWVLGFLLATPYILPLVEYAKTGARIAKRSVGAEERPPAGIAALPQVVLPEMYGAMESYSARVFSPDHQAESSAAAYAGAIATLFVAPLAWSSRRHRSTNIFWCVLAFFGLSWTLDVPGLVHLLRLPMLNMMSHNRLVFATAFAILSLTVIGLDALLRNEIRWRHWFWAPCALLAGLCCWCVFRAFSLQEPLNTQIEAAVRGGVKYRWFRGVADIHTAQLWFRHHYAIAACWCGLGAAAWCLLWRRNIWFLRFRPLVAGILVVELLGFGFGRAVQCDPALYFPPVPVLEAVAKSVPGRVIGSVALPANLATICGLRDVRGYDAVDPARLVQLIMLGTDPSSPASEYAQTQERWPLGTFSPEEGVKLSPILDLLGVKYVIYRGSPEKGTQPKFTGEDYWVLENARGLNRAFVPTSVECVRDDDVRVQLISATNFNPRAVAYVEVPVELPAACHGDVQIVSEIPTRVNLAAHMGTAGLVVLSDLWDVGWHAYLNGRLVPILRTDHALRGILVPAGESSIEFRYWPRSFTWGLSLAGFAGAILVVWLVIQL